MSKYIIKNCPALFITKDGEFKNDCCNKDGYSPCQGCTDCVMKQVVELCKESLNSLETYVDVRSFECVVLQNILQLLDIQEVE